MDRASPNSSRPPQDINPSTCRSPELTQYHEHRACQKSKSVTRRHRTCDLAFWIECRRQCFSPSLGDVYRSQCLAETWNHCFPLAFGSQTHHLTFTAMSFPGQYVLRASPFSGIGGMFATGNGIDEVVTTAAEVPSTFDAQFWDVIAVEGKDIHYRSAHIWECSWGKLVPAGKFCCLPSPRHHFTRVCRMAHLSIRGEF